MGVMLTRPCPLSGKTRTMYLPTEIEKVEKWMTERASCPLVQDMFPELDDDQREFVMTGIAPDSWAALWPEEATS